MEDIQSRGAFTIIDILEKAGYEAYLVGGCVRDLLLKKEVKDYDIATNATPEQVTMLFKKVIPVGISHGTVIVRKFQKSYEVTTFRKKSNNDEHSFVFGDSIIDDLSYRDFTINALAMDRNRQVIDLFGGQIDLQRNTIRAVNDAILRFSEDPLRMLRAIRFVSQLGFTIESSTLQAISTLKNYIGQVAIERIKDEMSALLQGEHFQLAVQYLVNTSLVNELPIFSEHRELVQILSKETKKFTSFVHAIALLHYYKRDVSINEWVKSWKCSNKEKNEITNLLTAIDKFKRDGINNWLIYELNESLDKPFCQLIGTIYNETIVTKELQLIRNKLAIRSRSDLAIDGNKIMKWFPTRKPGPWMQKLIEAIEIEVVMNRLKNDEQYIKEWITCHPLVTD